MNIFSNHQSDHKFITHLSFRKKISTAVIPTTSLETDTSTMTTDNEELSIVKPSGRNNNTTVDKSIDLQSYMTQAKISNQMAIQNAGTEIKANNLDIYQDTYFIFKKALEEKYTKLLQESKRHANSKQHIYKKYFDVNYVDYEGDLSDIERRIAYQYEMQLYKTNKIISVKYKDSLFRGITIDGTVVDADKNKFNRQMIYAQIQNILMSHHITLPESFCCTFTVDPYSYYISVNEYSKFKKPIENALNVGENGKNLYQHIRRSIIQEGTNQAQVTQNGYLKYQAYHQILNYTGLKLNELEEKNGAYYTLDGIDVYDIMSQAINNSTSIPNHFKRQLKGWINHLVSDLSLKGWNNIPDMTLMMCYNRQEIKNKF